MKQLNQWMHAHPYKAVLFTWFFSVVAGIMATVNATGFRYGLILFILGVVAWVAIYWKDARKLPIILSFITLVSATNAAEPPQPIGPVGIGVGVTVICVGGICVYKLVKFCQRKFPKTPETNTVQQVTGDADEFAASWNYGSLGTCDPTLGEGGPDFLAPELLATLFVIDISPQGTMTTSAFVGDAFTQSWTDFQAEAASHGLTITGSADGSQYFSCNRIPCAGNDITFDELTKTVAIGNGERLLEIERSRDLLVWSPFLKARVAAGSRGLRIEDATTSSSMFYRVTVSQ